MTDKRDIGPGLGGDLFSAFALLTRLPVPDHAPRGAAAAWAWPLVGAGVGGLAALVAAIGAGVGLPSGVTAAAALATMAVVTGALHEDGLADTADGFFGGHSRERRLEIMKDSHIGSFGTLALLLVTLARWSALVSLIAAGHAVVALIVAAAVSRVPMVALMAALPNARQSGLSHLTGRPGRDTAAQAAILAALIALVLVGWAALWLAPVLGVGTLAIARLATARIGGQTGDVLGASQQLAELACLGVLAAALI